MVLMKLWLSIYTIDSRGLTGKLTNFVCYKKYLKL